MKKTLITLLALAGVAAADSVLLESKLTNNGVSSSVMDAIYGKTQADAATASGLKVDRFAETKKDFTFSVSDLLTNATLGEDELYSINAITFASRYDTVANWNNTYAFTGTATVKINDVVVGTSTTLTLNPVANGNGTDYNIGTFTFGFDNAFLLDGTETVTISLNSSDNKKFGVAAVANNGTVTATDITDMVTSSSGDKYKAVVQLSGSVVTIPEPATATLSLLALAGLCARRRRK